MLLQTMSNFADVIPCFQMIFLFSALTVLDQAFFWGTVVKTERPKWYKLSTCVCIGIFVCAGELVHGDWYVSSLTEVT